MSAHRVRLSEIDPGHYWAKVGGVLYEMVRRRRQTPPRVIWELYGLVDSRRELIQQAPTLEVHRQKLDQLASPLPSRRQELMA